MEHVGTQEEPWDQAMASMAAARPLIVTVSLFLSSWRWASPLPQIPLSSLLLSALPCCILFRGKGFTLWGRGHMCALGDHALPGRPQMPGQPAWAINIGGRCCRSARVDSPQRHCVNGQTHQRVSPFHPTAPSRRLRSISSKDNMGENSNNLTVWSRDSAPSGRSGGS